MVVLERRTRNPGRATYRHLVGTLAAELVRGSIVSYELAEFVSLDAELGQQCRCSADLGAGDGHEEMTVGDASRTLVDCCEQRSLEGKVGRRSEPGRPSSTKPGGR